MASKGKGTKDQLAIYEPGNDVRLDFLFEYVTRSFKIKLEKWLKVLTTEEYRKLIVEFLETPDATLLCFTLNTAGILTTSNFYPTPAASKSKSCYFIKMQPLVTTKEDPTFKDNLVYGDLSAQTLSNLVTLVEEVVKPVMEVQMADPKWPEQVVADTKERSNDILNALHSLKGQLRGKTWLPMPSSLKEAAQNIKEGKLEKVDTNIQKQVETLLLKWSGQISEVLLRGSGEAFDSGRHPTPAAELLFWEARVDDLQCIYNQLHEEGAQAIAGILEARSVSRSRSGSGPPRPSRYSRCFKAIISNVQGALEEATSILTYFKPLRRHFDLLSAASFDHEMYDLLRPMMHCLCYMWAFSTYYRTSTHIIVLFKEICNLLIDLARTFLCGSLIFQIEPDQGLSKLKNVLETLHYFKELFHAHKAALHAYFDEGAPVVHWDFLPSLIFGRFDRFIQRISQLTKIFECTVEFYKLDKVEIGGSRGRSLGLQMLDIHCDFVEYFQSFSSISYDCCDPDDPSFDRDNGAFILKTYEVDCRLSYVIYHAIDDCHTPESAHKLIMVLGPLLTRPLIQEDVAVKYLKYVQLIDQELDQILELFQEQICNIKDITKRKSVSTSLPPYSATIHFIKNLKDRVTGSMTQFLQLDLAVAKESEGVALALKYHKTIQQLSEFQEQTFMDWIKNVETTAKIYLQENLLTQVKHEVNQKVKNKVKEKVKIKIMVNLNPGLTATLKEIKYLKMAGFDLYKHPKVPKVILELQMRHEEFRKNSIFLHEISSWYNHIQENLHHFEEKLLKNRLHRINVLIQRGQREIKWEDRDEVIWDFIQELMEPVESLKKILDESQENWRVVSGLIQSWVNDGPMFIRKDRKNFNMLDLQLASHDMEPPGEIVEKVEENPETAATIDGGGGDLDLKGGGEGEKEKGQDEPISKKDEEEETDDANEGEIKQEGLAKQESQSKSEKGGQGQGQIKNQSESREIVDITSENLRDKKYLMIIETSRKIQELCLENRKLLVEEPITLEMEQNWQDYLGVIDEEIHAGLVKTVAISFGYLLDHTDFNLTPSTLMEVQMKLENGVLFYSPALDEDLEDSFLEKIHWILSGIVQQAVLVDRIRVVKRTIPISLDGSSLDQDTNSDPDMDQQVLVNYLEDIQNDPDLSEMVTDLLDRANSVTKQAAEYTEAYERFAYLWEDDRPEHLRQFLQYGHQLTQVELDLKAEGEEIPVTPATLAQFKESIDKYEKLLLEVDQLESEIVIDKWFRLSMQPFRKSLHETVEKWSLMFKQHLIDTVTGGLSGLEKFVDETEAGLQQPLAEGDLQTLISVMDFLQKVKHRVKETDGMFEPIKEFIDLLKYYEYELPESVFVQLEELPERWTLLKKQAQNVRMAVAPLQQNEVSSIRKRILDFDAEQTNYREIFKTKEFFNVNCPFPYQEINTCEKDIAAIEAAFADLVSAAKLFEVHVIEPKALKQCRKEIRFCKQLWDYQAVVDTTIEDWKQTPWASINAENMDLELKRMQKDIKALDKDVKMWDIFTGLESLIRNMVSSLKSVGELQNPAISDRHWEELLKSTRILPRLIPIMINKFVRDERTTLADLYGLSLHNFEEEVKNVVDKAVKESSMEKTLKELGLTWAVQEYQFEIHPATGTKLVKTSEELIEILEDNQVQLQNIAMSKYIAFFREEVEFWQKRLAQADNVLSLVTEVQRTWSHLESIFVGSEDIRINLPQDSARFDEINRDIKATLEKMYETTNVIEGTSRPEILAELEHLQGQLILCEKALANYLETKRLKFPRFYFVSSADLLDILSNGNAPKKVTRHLTKVFDSLASLVYTLAPDEKGQETDTKIAHSMKAKDGEVVPFSADCTCCGPVEDWLTCLEASMRQTIREHFDRCVHAYGGKSREKWILDFPAQVALCGTQIWWTTEVNVAFSKLEDGNENSLKEYFRRQVVQLNTLINLLIGELTSGERQKIMTICTIDVHSRDVVGKMIQARIETAQAFQWQSQLRHRWDEEEGDCFSNICDAQLRYLHEYLGNTPRLVITPLTDRCYITLTQSLHLIMGGAPAGPAGTGKTETTKDLGRALGVMVYVFNCSEQMDYKSIGSIFKGLSMTGAWGCFDEFNRISVEVLSVVAVQVKSMQDAIRDRKIRFNFMGEEIGLKASVGVFITMNPGYAGRSELPENLKVLFRPCAMVVPDFELICEIMLVAEGFLDARLLARKFITLYTLCKELLSKQDHYDWGLRAIKSVLVVAGSLKRGDPGRPEDEVLMRALRDFNIPKIIWDDTPVFMGLIGDLFPALDVPRKRDVHFENIVKEATSTLQLQPEENFVLKVVQLQELLDVRHSVFVLGQAGTGKSQVWKTLFQTYQQTGQKAVFNDLNPKAVTNDELFGIISGVGRDWKDGIFSVVMRDQANMTIEGPKWIVLDGDIDPMWIESLNTVMDDNKVLTLASNERIALTKSMRLIFEIYTLKHATPATVSRAGILYLNPSDLGWSPYVTSWVGRRRENREFKQMLSQFFEKYIPSVMEAMKSRFKRIVPIPEISHVQLLCNLLHVLLDPATMGPPTPSQLTPAIRQTFEVYFVFACVWAFGSALVHDQTADHRLEFSKWWQSEWKTVVLPPNVNSVFEFFIDPETSKLTPWTEIVPKFDLDPDVPLQSTLVHTAETIRVKYFLDLLMEQGHPVTLVGGAGSGKTVLIGDKLASLPDNYAVANVPFNFYTTSEMLQKILEKPLEKKAGRNFGPAGNKQLVYFIDDLNMPMVDDYETVQPHTIVRQHLDYGHWYDRIKLQLKDIHNVQYVAAMNPTAGSFTINPRLQRHFAVFSIGFPGAEALHSIYKTLLQQHLSHNILGNTPVHKMAGMIVTTALSLHTKVTQNFLPTAVKFHYVFNLRDLSNIFQGLLFSSADCLRSQYDLVRLWMHESSRVYQDKLTDDKDIAAFQKFLYECFKKGFEDLDETVLLAQPLIYYHFALGAGEAKYMPVTDFPTLQNSLMEALKSYNDFNSIMNLVLFDAAINYVCRISRILESPRGNALLVGVGGSGKQSLARLAAFLSGIDVFQVTLRKGYSTVDLKADLATLYLKGGKNLGTMFLMTDAQVAEERFLVLINDMLASGEIPDLLPDDEVENLISQMRSEVKGVGLQDTRENCWKFFIDRVRKVLKVVLCMSPVGNTLRNRSRKFPAVTNSTQIIWFHEWPSEALISVSQRFVKDISVLPSALHDPVASFMAFVHTSVSEVSRIYLANDKRYNYTTPKSFLEQIDLYEKLVTKNTNEAIDKASRLEAGLAKLEICAEEVETLKQTLAVQEVVLKEKNDKADELIKIVGEETAVVTTEKENAAVEEAKVAIVAEEVAQIQVVCQAELEKAEPALQAAYAALNTLNKTNLTELKTFTTPPADVVVVVAAVFILWEGTRTGKLPRDKSWKVTKSQMMGDIGKFLDGLQNLNKEGITPMIVDALKPYITDPAFQPELIRAKSLAASGLCSYVINVLKFNEVYQDVAPKRKALAEATSELNANLNKLAFLKGRIKELEEKLEILTKEFEAATEAKMICQAEADKTTATIDLANRLVGGLASEKVRWIQNVKNYKESTVTIPGDMLLVTAFVSYMGCFTKNYRIELLERIWVPYLERMTPPIPMSGNIDPLTVLTDDAEIARWNSFGLPNDRMSSENATILINSQRWPLLIDPQLQGLKWIKNMYGASKLKVIRLGQKGYLDVIEEEITKGGVVLLENLYETIDPVLEPLLARNLVKKGTAIKIGDKEVDYNPNFRLILQSKLANPHYQPEMQAQTTLINFTVTRDGLEDQLLAEVVKVERPDLEMQKSELTSQQNEFKVLLRKLEEDLLSRLQSADSNNLLSESLVINLEITKKTAGEVEVKAREAVITSADIDAARELYRPASSRASLLYFILNDLNKIHPIYQFSLKAFSTVFHNAIKLATPAALIPKRVENLIDSITHSVWLYTTRGLFESDKLIFTATLAFQIQLTKDAFQPRDFDFLLRFPVTPNVVSPVDFLSHTSWGAVRSLALLDDFRDLDRDIENYPKKWVQIVDSDYPEREKLPGEWKTRDGIQKLCIMRCLRPDRMTYSVSVYIEENLGVKYVKARRMDFSQSFEETSKDTPVFFILSPGVDPLKDVETLGKKLGYTIDQGNFHNVSLGQGQEVVAESALEMAAREGHWVILQNIHLVARWLPTLEKKLEMNWDNSSENYRVFLSAEPASTHEGHLIPQGILESSIKITNEAPTGMLANVHKALDNFSQETMETCSKEMEFKAILFTLCYFHAVVAERRKFGTQGWNRPYPFSTGDLTISVNVLYNYLEANNKIPWDDLRYLFGEIMYGGHITDDWDRKLCRTYLEEFMVPESLDGEIEYAPGFPAPPSTDFAGYHAYIDELLPTESPTLYGLHPNAEIGFLTTTSNTLFKTILELQPKDTGGGAGLAATKDEKIKGILDDILDKLPEPFNMSEITARAEEKTPYVIVALQECERMNTLTMLMRKSLRELDSALKGELGITQELEDLGSALFMDQVPNAWAKRAYNSTFGLGSWYADLLLRCRELEIWSADFLLPPSVWLAGFFNPQSFLTAIMQSTARRQELPLDKMCLQCDVTKKTKEETTAAPKEGACIHGLFMEGARWDMMAGAIAESRPKELYPPLPVLFLKAITQDKQDNRNSYECPVYKTRLRGPNYIWTFNLRIKDKPAKWVLSGVAILLQV